KLSATPKDEVLAERNGCDDGEPEKLSARTSTLGVAERNGAVAEPADSSETESADEIEEGVLSMPPSCSATFASAACTSSELGTHFATARRGVPSRLSSDRRWPTTRPSCSGSLITSCTPGPWT